MMKYLILCLLMFFGSMTLAAENVSIGQLDQQLSDSLDNVIECGDVMPPSTNGVGGQAAKELGRMIWLAWVRSGYYNGYINPAVEATKSEVTNYATSVEFRDLPEYKTAIQMTTTDEAFTSCPKNVEAFKAAFDARLQAELPR
jgi:hypothetical protein